MSRILSFFTYIFIIGLVIYVFVSIPTFSSVISCYDKNKQSFDEAELGSRAQGYSDYRLCQLKQESVYRLSLCLQQVNQYSNLSEDMFNNLIMVLTVIRPDIYTIDTIQKNFNQECFEYPSLLFDLPEM